MVKYYDLAVHIRKIQLFFLLHLHSSAGGFCDGFLNSSCLVIWHKKVHNHSVRIFCVKNGQLIFPGNVLQLADGCIIRCKRQGNAVMLLNYLACPKACLHGSGISPHKTACAKKHASEVSGDNHGYIVDVLSENHIQHRPACSS